MSVSGTPATVGQPPAGRASVTAGAGESWSDKVKTIGGLVAVAIGVSVVGVIAVIALVKDTSTAATIASSTGGVVATIVGAYFGVKVGSDQSKAAIEGQQAEAAKAQVYAAHLPPEKADQVLQLADQAVARVRGR